MDASAVIAVIADEPDAQKIINYTKNSIIISPNIISFEISNALTRMMKKHIITSEEQMLGLVKNFLQIPIRIINIDLEKALKIAWKYKIYAYDAYYLEVAMRLHIPLVTFDGGMIKIGNELGLVVFGG